MSLQQTTVAISSDFFNAYSKLPQKVQNRITNFLSKFHQDPTMPGINYEKIRDAGNPGFRSVRIDDTYRGIVLKPEEDNVYVLLWVDHHDRAYAWARRKKCSVHPDTGSLQVYEAVQAEPEKSGEQGNVDQPAELPGLFDHVRDRHLLKLGIPQELLSRVRVIVRQEDLDAMLDLLPQEAYEALFFLAEGFSVEYVFQEMDKSDASKEVDTSDVRSALQNVDSQQRFHVVTDDLELQAMLQAPLEKWRVFLHPTQRKLVERSWNGPVRVLGEAGTGKTVAAMHRAKWLARNSFAEDKEHILFTTFTKNLAADIYENLHSICSSEELKRIEVVNLDKWVSDFLKSHGYSSSIVYSDQTDPLWKLAMATAPDDPAFPLSFYREEWENVLQPQEVNTFADYCQASRKGRGVPLNRKTRKAIWPVFEEYRLQLNKHGWREPDDAMRDARNILQSQNISLPYSSIVVDEAQDMGVQAFKLLRQVVPERANDLFIVGDGHQRIYRHKVVLGRCGIKIVGRSRKLRVNYRTTEETRRWATGVLEGVSIDDLDEGQDNEKGTTSLLRGKEPLIKNFDSFDHECQFLADLAREKEQLGDLSTTCLVARTHSRLNQYAQALQQKGVAVYPIKTSAAEDRNAHGIRLATMHRVKGLEFETIIIAGAKEGDMPLRIALETTDDDAEREDRELRERALFYVAATRAKKEVVVTSFGQKSVFLEKGSI